MKEVLESRAIIVGSITPQNDVFPPVCGFLTYLLGFRPKSKIWATFGSYSSEGGPVEQINERLKSAGNEPVESVEVNFKPNAEDLVKCYAMGQKIASLVKTLNSAR